MAKNNRHLEIKPLPATGNTVDMKGMGDSLLRMIAIEKLKESTKLYYNLGMIDASIRSLRESFINNCLSGCTALEYNDRIEKFLKAKTMIEGLIDSKIDEHLQGASNGKQENP